MPMLDLDGRELIDGQRIVTNSNGISSSSREYSKRSKLTIKTVVGFTPHMVKLAPGDFDANECVRMPHNVVIIGD